MSIIDTTIARLQVIADACVGVKTAPNYPTEDAAVLPMSIAHITGGDVTAVNATDTKLKVNISVDFHFSRTMLKETYQNIDALIPDFIQRLGGDPTLNSSVSTIVFPVPFTVVPTAWDQVMTQMVQFVVTVKFNLLTPTVTP